MKKKIMVAVMLTMMLTINAFAAPALMTVNAETASSADVFTYGESKIEKITEADGTEHLADLTAWGGSAAAEAPTTTVIGEVTYYQIEDGADLAWFADFVNTNTGTENAPAYANLSANAVLVNDINLNSKNWADYIIAKCNKTSTTRSGQEYSGIFDGQGHTIYNFYVRYSDSTNVGGLFHNITGGTLKNVNFINARHSSQYSNGPSNNTRTAIVTGYLGSNAVVDNVRVSGKISAETDKYVNTAGSIAAHIGYNATITNCWSDVIFDLSKSNTTKNSSSTDNNVNYGIGGIVGYADQTNGNFTISNCGFEGEINAPNSSRVGGIVGNIKGNNSGTIQNCYNTADITAYRQIGGIIGWVNTGSHQKATGLYKNLYNTGDITALVATTTYASGIANGAYAKTISNVYSTGDVSVDVSGELTFNDTCALLYTHLGSTTGNDRYKISTGAYCKDYTYVDSTGASVAKHSHAGTYSTKTYSNENGYTEAQFKTETVLTTIGASNFSTDTGINSGYPILTWQTTAPLAEANTYYLSGEDTLTLTLDRAGSVAFEITPLGTGSEVTAAGETITEKGTHTFKSTGTTLTVSVTGSALITRSLMNQKSGQSIENVEPEIIRFNADTSDAGVVILALYDGVTGNVRKTVKYTNFSDMIIDLTNEDTTGCTLKVFLWKDLDSVEPVAAPYILEPAEVIDHSAGIEAFDGKKVIFIGNSYVYYGKTTNHKGNNMPEMTYRTNDKGGFYKLCKANGIDVSVTNWTFSAHGLYQLFNATCTHSDCADDAIEHEDYLTDRYYDYVFISPGRSNSEQNGFKENMDYIIDLFKEENPNVKFVLIGHTGHYGISNTNVAWEGILSQYEAYEEQGVIIADWGYIVKKALEEGVAGSNQDYVKSSFIVGDDYHPNLLGGYITTLTAYCAVTGESAVIQPHSYVSDFDIPAYTTEYYTNGDADTNFPEILDSAYEMRLLKKHIDTYLNK